MIQLIPHNPTWKEKYQAITKSLAKHFEGLTIQFHPIGSTPLPGCVAKPIIDILGVVSDINLIDPYNAAMKKEGYIPLGEFGMKQRRYFRKEAVHLHIFEDSDPEVTRHLRFVSYLDSHPDQIEKYNHLKKQLAKEYQDDREGYTAGKTAWIKSIDCLAAKEANATPYPSLGPRKANWSSQEVIHALHVNMHLQMTLFSKYTPSIEWIYHPNATIICSEIQDSTFNFVFNAQLTQKKKVKEILTHFQNHSFSWWLSRQEDTPASLPEWLQEEGLQPTECEKGMFLRLDAYHPQLIGHKITRVHTQDQLKTFADLVTQVGGHPEAYDRIYQHIPPILYTAGSMELYLLYDEKGQAATTGMLVKHASVMGIYYITTHPTYRRLGYASEMMSYLLQKGKEAGYSIATLAATEVGEEVYQKMGFQTCCQFEEFGKP